MRMQSAGHMLRIHCKNRKVALTVGLSQLQLQYQTICPQDKQINYIVNHYKSPISVNHELSYALEE